MVIHKGGNQHRRSWSSPDPNSAPRPVRAQIRHIRVSRATGLPILVILPNQEATAERQAGAQQQQDQVRAEADQKA